MEMHRQVLVAVRALQQARTRGRFDRRDELRLVEFRLESDGGILLVADPGVHELVPLRLGGAEGLGDLAQDRLRLGLGRAKLDVVDVLGKHSD